MPSTPIARIALALALVVVTAACGGGDDGEPAATSSDAAQDGGSTDGSTVTIELVAFAPQELEVEAGTTVTWSNEDPGTHTVTSGEVEQGTSGVTQAPDGRFDSGTIAGDGSFEHTFDEPGTYPYFCALHPATMSGVVNVR